MNKIIPQKEREKFKKTKSRTLLEDGEFIEVYIKCPVDVYKQRDPKGLYQKARQGEIKEFTSISAPYEVPLDPEIVLETGKLVVEESVKRILDYLEDRKII